MRHQLSTETRHHRRRWLRSRHGWGGANQRKTQRGWDGRGTAKAAVSPPRPPPPLHRVPQSHLETCCPVPAPRGSPCERPRRAPGPGLEGKTDGFRPEAAAPQSRRTTTATGTAAPPGFKAKPLHVAVGACWERPGFPQRHSGSRSRPGPRMETGRGTCRVPSPAKGCEPHRCHHQGPGALTAHLQWVRVASLPGPGPLGNPQITESPGTSILSLICGLKYPQVGFDAVHYKQLSSTALLAVIPGLDRRRRVRGSCRPGWSTGSGRGREV